MKAKKQTERVDDCKDRKREGRTITKTISTTGPVVFLIADQRISGPMPACSGCGKGPLWHRRPSRLLKLCRLWKLSKTLEKSLNSVAKPD